MFKTILLATLVSALKAYIGSGIYDRIVGEVINLTVNDTMTGAEKMTRVITFAKKEAYTVSEYLIKAVVELTLFRVTQS